MRSEARVVALQAELQAQRKYRVFIQETHWEWKTWNEAVDWANMLFAKNPHVWFVDIRDERETVVRSMKREGQKVIEVPVR